MHSAWRTQRNWAFCAVVTGTLIVFAQPALAQKFARRSPANSNLVAADESEGPELVAAAPPRRGVQFRSPKTLSHQVPDRGFHSPTVPEWQRGPGPRFQPASKRMLQQVSPPDIELPMNQAMSDGGEVIVDDGSMQGQGEVIGQGTVDGQMIEEGQDGDVIYEEGDFDPWAAGMDGGCASCGQHVCGPECDDGCPWARPCDGICIPRHRIDETAFFIGPQAFKGPLDLGKNGNFGFHEGVNFAGQFGRWLGLGGLGIGYQIGATFVQSDFSGNNVNGAQTKERDQQFITAGLFRRAHRGRGLQYGAVFDWLHDNYYVKYNVAQVRAELSYLTSYGHEFGFWGAFHAKPSQATVNGVLTTYQTIDMYNLFYRYNLPNGSQGRIWAGGTGNKAGILGADFRIVVTNRWDLMGAFNYLIPAQGAGLAGAANEAWGMGLNLVWYPGRRCHGSHNTPYRALFMPADNSTLIARQLGL
ncbi:MAG TPA: DUF6666 family protein [Pirellulales bacterium]|nr:DUF6666 family protein [Pirellulales bacterium]